MYEQYDHVNNALEAFHQIKVEKLTVKELEYYQNALSALNLLLDNLYDRKG